MLALLHGLTTRIDQGYSAAKSQQLNRKDVNVEEIVGGGMRSTQTCEGVRYGAKPLSKPQLSHISLVGAAMRRA